jgi:hypothetical protein
VEPGGAGLSKARRATGQPQHPGRMEPCDVIDTSVSHRQFVHVRTANRPQQPASDVIFLSIISLLGAPKRSSHHQTRRHVKNEIVMNATKRITGLRSLRCIGKDDHVGARNSR